MAKGKKCPQCGQYMYAIKETYHSAGTEVIYQCNNNNYNKTGEPCGFKEKVFEDK